jgi:hypothetical protein
MSYSHDTNLRDLDPEARGYKSKYERDEEAFDEMEADEDRHKERDEDND